MRQTLIRIYFRAIWNELTVILAARLVAIDRPVDVVV